MHVLFQYCVIDGAVDQFEGDLVLRFDGCHTRTGHAPISFLLHSNDSKQFLSNWDCKMFHSQNVLIII